MSVEVLMVEDNPGDVRLMREALRSSTRAIKLHVTVDGAEALDFLNQRNNYVHAPRPALILLDLNLPKINGREVLAQIKQDDSLKTITDHRPDHIHGPVGYRTGVQTQRQLLYQQAIAAGRTGSYRRHHQ